MEFHHFGIACREIAPVRQFLEHTHPVQSVSPELFDPQQNAKLCMVTMAAGPHIEIISGAMVEKFVKKNITNYHICYTVDSIQPTIDRFINQGGMLISPPKPALLFDNRSVAFLHTPIGLIELLEK
jgi:methylmalonyl-CoA/ethylmalonyl-CoA epimerase